MAISSLYQLDSFPNDKTEVVMNRLTQNPKMKLVTVAQDYELHDKLQRWGISNDQSLNMYDWLQGAVNYDHHAYDYDFRVLPRYDKRELIMAPVTRGNENYLDLKHDGHRFARLDWQPGHIDRTKTQTLYTNDQTVWAKDFYDVRGFLSRRQYFNPDGKLGMELVYHVDGTPVLEISHMGDKTMYRLLGTHGLPNWLLQNELSLMLWWQGELLKHRESEHNTTTETKLTVYNDEPVLDAVWTQLNTKINLIEVAHATDLTQQRVNELQNRERVVAVNQALAKAYHYNYMEPWRPRTLVHQKHDYDHKRVAGVGRWLTNDQVDQLVAIIKDVHREVKDVKIDLFGYFTVDTQKYYKQQIKKLKLDGVATIRGNQVGQARSDGWQQAAIAWYFAQVTDSSILPHLLNYDGVPVVTNVAGLRGAYVSADKPKLFAQGIVMGLNKQRLWRKDVKQNAR